MPVVADHSQALAKASIILATSFVTATFAALNQASDAISNEGLSFITSGGIVTVGLGVGLYLLRRSDEREKDMREEAEEKLQKEKAAHEETMKKYITLLEKDK